MAYTFLLIFTLQVIYVSLLTIRVILTVRGYRYAAAFLSCVDIMVYVIGFKVVMDNLSNPLNLFVYCLSYGIGILMGVKIEQKLAIGFLNIQVITKHDNLLLAHSLREKGFGVTMWMGEGLDGQRSILSIVTQRKNQASLYKEIKGTDPDAFIVAYEPKHLYGGFILESVQMKKARIK